MVSDDNILRFPSAPIRDESPEAVGGEAAHAWMVSHLREVAQVAAFASALFAELRNGADFDVDEAEHYFNAELTRLTAEGPVPVNIAQLLARALSFHAPQSNPINLVEVLPL